MLDHDPDQQVISAAHARVAARRAAADTECSRRWVLIFVLLLLLLPLLLWLVPGASLDARMRWVARGLVAQQHNLYLDGRQLPLCARNLGIYSMVWLGWMLLWLGGRSRAAGLPPRPLLLLLGVGALAMLLDGFNSLSESLGGPILYVPNNPLRTASGIGMGMALVVVAQLAFSRLWHAGQRRQDQPVLNWPLAGLLVLLGAGLMLAVYGQADILFWPIALLSFAGILFSLFASALLLLSQLLGYAGRVRRLQQLAQPATLALCFTLGYVAVFRLLRFWADLA